LKTSLFKNPAKGYIQIYIDIIVRYLFAFIMYFIYTKSTNNNITDTHRLTLTFCHIIKSFKVHI
jgi:hypothetical protein